MALLYGDFETARMMLKHGADPNACSSKLLPRPLIYSVQELCIARLLVEYGLKIGSYSQLLHSSMCFTVPSDLVHYYLQHGANPFEQDECGGAQRAEPQDQEAHAEVPGAGSRQCADLRSVVLREDGPHRLLDAS